MRSDHRVDYTMANAESTQRMLEKLKQEDPAKYDDYLRAKFNAEMENQLTGPLKELRQNDPEKFAEYMRLKLQAERESGPLVPKQKNKHKGKSKASHLDIPPINLH